MFLHREKVPLFPLSGVFRPRHPGIRSWCVRCRRLPGLEGQIQTDVQGGIVQPFGLECEAAGTAVVAPNSMGLDKTLTPVVTQFFEDYSVPPNFQKRFLKSLEDLQIYNLNGLRLYSRNCPHDFKTIFGAFGAYWFEQTQVSEGHSLLHQNDPSQQRGLGRDVLEYFKANSVSNRSVSSENDITSALHKAYDTSGVDLSLLNLVVGTFVRDFREMKPEIFHQWYNVKNLFHHVRSVRSTWPTQKILEVLGRLLSVQLVSPYPASRERMCIWGDYCGSNNLPVVLAVIKNTGMTERELMAKEVFEHIIKFLTRVLDSYDDMEPQDV